MKRSRPRSAYYRSRSETAITERWAGSGPALHGWGWTSIDGRTGRDPWFLTRMADSSHPVSEPAATRTIVPRPDRPRARSPENSAHSTCLCLIPAYSIPWKDLRMRLFGNSDAEGWGSSSPGGVHAQNLDACNTAHTNA